MNKKLKQALALQEKSEFSKAKAAFKQIIKKNPSDLVSQYSLGVIALKLGSLDNALKYFNIVAELKPDFAQAWLSRGIVLQTLHRDVEALASYNRALEIDPEYTQAKVNRDAQAAMIGSKTETASARVIKTLEDMRTKAVEFQEKGQLVEAQTLFNKILEISPSEFVSLYSMAVIAIKNGNLLEALVYAEKTTKTNPNYAPAWYNQGTILYSLKRNEEALANFDKALSVNPLYVEALVNRGAVLQELNRHAEAVDNFNRLLALEPENEKALANKGVLLTQFKRYDEAIIEFEKLIKINPDYDNLLGEICFAYLHMCRWDKLEDISALISKGLKTGKQVCKSLALMAISSVAHDHLLCSQIYSCHMCPPAANPVWKGEQYNHEKIRLAYISPDLRQHPVGHLMAGIFENHDKSKFEIISISLGIDDQSDLRRRFMEASDKFIDARQMNSRDIAELIRSLEVDIAVDLAGYTADSRTNVFALRPAPIQVNYLGFAGTMGAKYMDYILADKYVIPKNDRVNFSEKVIYLPDTYLPTDGSLRVAERMPTREEYGLPETGFIFCSFNHDYKINPLIFDVWMRLLKRIPGSVLWLMKLNSFAETNLIREANARGVEPGRMVFATRVPTVEDHLARYKLAGLFLDTTPYNAHTTASDALFAGLPVLTCQGSAFPGRVAGSLLHAIGLPELIAGSLAEYEEMAIKLALDPKLLEDIKNRLRVNKESYPLFDTKQFCRNLEAAFTSMWESNRQNQVKTTMEVVPSSRGVRHPMLEVRQLKIALEKSPNMIYDRIVEELALGFSNCGHECIVIDPAIVKTKLELLDFYNQCDWVIISNGSGYLSLKWPDIYLFEELSTKIVFLHHDAPFNTRMLNDIQGKLDAYVRIKDRSIHFTIEKSDAEDFRKLGMTAHTISHINTLGSLTLDSEKTCLRDVAFIGHVVPPVWTPFLFGAEQDSAYYNSYLSRVSNLNHRIKDDYCSLMGIDYNNGMTTAAEVGLKMHYIQHVHLYSQPHRGAVLEKVCGHGVHIYGGDPSWVHGIEQSRYLGNANITYHKPVFQREQVKELFSTTRINVNITSLQFDTAVINRVMDCAAVGGFILTDRKEQLYELTSVADEISYGTTEELVGKIDYYMGAEHQEQRKEICRQLQLDLDERCSTAKAVEYMLIKMNSG